MKLEYALLGFFALIVLVVALVTGFAMMYHLIPFLLGVFCQIACILALWSISFYFGTRAR